MSTVKELVYKNRSYRRFQQEQRISLDGLRELVDLGRMSASGGNLQALKYIICSSFSANARIFPYLNWAGYLPEWPGPEEGERPAAYIVMLWDTEVKPGKDSHDPGIAAQSIMLGAAEQGLGGCMIGSIKREGLVNELTIDERYDIILLLALGKPKETVGVDELKPGESHKYWRDDSQVHHVPKRRLKDIILAEYD
jgi:nitroreductase